MAEVDPLLPKRLQDNVAVRKGEQRVYAATVRALTVLGREIHAQCVDSHYAPTDTRTWPAWEAALDSFVVPALTSVFVTAFDDPQSLVAAGSINARENAGRFMRAVYNRLVRAADDVWASVQKALTEGVEKHEAIPDLARKVDAALAEQGAERWRGRATTIARTETIAAFNNGRLEGGRALAAAVGIPERDVFKRWLSTHGDGRTRPTHRVADGQIVPVNTRFTVGGARGSTPGDPMLPPHECVNCRCTVLVLLPGDRGYPESHKPQALSLAASGLLTFDFNPAQKRGPDGRWIKFLTQRDAFKSLRAPRFWQDRDDEDLVISNGPAFRDWNRAGRPQDHPNALAFNRIRTVQRQHRKDTPATSDNVLAWFRPSKNKDKDFPDNPKVGDVIADQAPIATETQKPTHVKPKVLYAIRIPAGSEGIIPIADKSKYAYYEGAQIPPGAKLRVADVREENGQRLITVDLLPADVEPDPVVPKPEPVVEPAPTPQYRVGQKVTRGETIDMPVGSRVVSNGGTGWEKTDEGWVADGGSGVARESMRGGTVERVGPTADVPGPTPEPAPEPVPAPEPAPAPAPEPPAPSVPKVGDRVGIGAGYEELPLGSIVQRGGNSTAWMKVGDGTWRRADGKGGVVGNDGPSESSIVREVGNGTVPSFEDPTPTPTPTPTVKVGDEVDSDAAQGLPVGSLVKSSASGYLWERTATGWKGSGDNGGERSALPRGGTVQRIGPGEDVAPAPDPTPAPGPLLDPKVGDRVTRENANDLPNGSIVRNDSGGEWVRVDNGWARAPSGRVARIRTISGGEILKIGKGKAAPKPAAKPIVDDRPRNDDPTMRASTPGPGIPDPQVGKPFDPSVAVRDVPEGMVIRDSDGRTYTWHYSEGGWKPDDGGYRPYPIPSPIVVSAPDLNAYPNTPVRNTQREAIDGRARLSKSLPTGYGYDPIYDGANLPAPGEKMSVADAQAGANPFNESYSGLGDDVTRAARSKFYALPGTKEYRSRPVSMRRQFGINCQRVAAAFEMRRRGYDVAAGPGSGGATAIVPEVWQEVDGKARQPENFNSFEKMQARALLDGEGARYTVFGAWKSGGAHIWNAEVVGGKLEFYEAQVKGVDGNNHSKSVSWRGTSGFDGVALMRVDDLTPHPSMFESGYLLATPPAPAVGA